MINAASEMPARECILCAEINIVMSELTVTEDGMERENTYVSASLAVGFTEEDYDNFIKKLDVEYDDGYGTQELDGIIWLTDGTWMDRGEYDGSEWWQHQKCPEIPTELERKT